MFYIDLDQIETLDKRLRWFSYNKFNIFSFRDKDHLEMEEDLKDNRKVGDTNSTSSISNFPSALTTKQQITAYLQTNGVAINNGKIMLLTNLCVLGYNFNPVSFYFCFDEQENPLCAVAEISNTYREMKMFFFSKEDLIGNTFKLKTEKLFYVSPFIDLDTFFDFKLTIPDATLAIKIDDYDSAGNRFFISTLMGKQKALNNANLLRYFFRIPLIPLQVMWLIHWQAFKLWLKKINYHPKASNQHLQKNVYKRYKP